MSPLFQKIQKPWFCTIYGTFLFIYYNLDFSSKIEDSITFHQWSFNFMQMSKKKLMHPFLENPDLEQTCTIFRTLSLFITNDSLSLCKKPKQSYKLMTKKPWVLPSLEHFVSFFPHFGLIHIFLKAKILLTFLFCGALVSWQKYLKNVMSQLFWNLHSLRIRSIFDIFCIIFSFMRKIRRNQINLFYRRLLQTDR